MAFLIGGANTESAAYQIDNSVRFNNDDSSFIHKASLGSSSSNAKKWTVSFWAKLGPGLTAHRCVFSAGEASGGEYVQINFSDEDKLQIYSSNQFGQADNTATVLRTNALYRDVSAWYHVVYAIDFTDGTAGDRIKLYVNGSRVTSFELSNNIPAQNTDNDRIGANNIDHFIGKFVDSSSEYFDGYLAEFHFIDGDAKASTDFGKTDTNGVWVPKKYGGSYGNNGFFLDFREPNIGNANEEAIGNIGADYSGNANHFASSGITTLDQTTDTPTNNFATLNSLSDISTSVTFSEGNTKASIGAGSTNRAVGNMGFTSGKWYYEVKYVSTSASASYLEVGFVNTDISMRYHVRGSDGERWDNGSPSSSTSYRHDPDDIIGVYIDADNKKWYIQVNGSNEDVGNGTADVSAGTGFVHQNFAVTDFILPYFANASGSGGHVFEINFGNAPFSISSGNADANGYGSFEYNPTNDGVDFYALNTKNLAEYG